MIGLLIGLNDSVAGCQNDGRHGNHLYRLCDRISEPVTAVTIQQPHGIVDMPNDQRGIEPGERFVFKRFEPVSPIFDHVIIGGGIGNEPVARLDDRQFGFVLGILIGHT